MGPHIDMGLRVGSNHWAALPGTTLPKPFTHGSSQVRHHGLGKVVLRAPSFDTKKYPPVQRNIKGFGIAYRANNEGRMVGMMPLNRSRSNHLLSHLPAKTYLFGRKIFLLGL